MFFQVGQYWNLPPELMDPLEAFTCRIYAPKTISTKVNALRYHLFCSFCAKMARWQVISFRHAETALSNMLRGQTIKLQYGEDAWRRVPKSHVAMLDLLTCKCERKCELPRYACLINGLKCTDMCKLKNCDHLPSTSDDYIIQPDTDEEEEDEVYEVSVEYKLKPHEQLHNEQSEKKCELR